MLPGVFALAASLLLSSCAIGPEGVMLSRERQEENIPMRSIPAERAWINAPDTQLVLQRELVFGPEQRISLRNRTLVPGDNILMIRTRSGMRASGPLRFEELVRWVGELPPPFADVTTGEMISDNDELGSYLWTEERFGNDTVCVLGLRRVNSSMRQIPGGDDVMDIMLRNCVAGTSEDALQPLLAASITSPALAQSGAGQSRLISPLAGPSR
ncbi:hypothetical protein [Paracoccus benzoatiresistens]|uniref:Uncharacterized protein n=1 Tax=Paracoccus benzoatiresistens TaxID=2997341 RepID=A0ABT4JC99_9RHOB|nr:hypothetical protein [Paracoccus sp. EF6]MCZ0964197.1 hypothetical protein [Paracoccus sp. EF6]